MELDIKQHVAEYQDMMKVCATLQEEKQVSYHRTGVWTLGWLAPYPLRGSGGRAPGYNTSAHGETRF